MGETTKKLLHCYNKGCGKTFEPDNNTEGGCIFHSGEPYFHDAYKEWTCCKKKNTDFTEFLNIKGCAQGKHNGTRPKHFDKPKIEPDEMMKNMERIFTKFNTNISKKEARVTVSDQQPLVQLTPQISSRLLEQLSVETQKPAEVFNDGTIAIGTACKNTSCGVSYGPNISPECVHHPGTAIFHEGLKYWSCCKKITSDFNKFLDQIGCTTGTHLWFKKKEAMQCRVDWHQTGSLVVVSIFGKNYDPHKSAISLSQTRLKVSIFFPKEAQVFEKEFKLGGIVKVEGSTVSMLPTKVEIKLVKAWGEIWKDLSADS